MTINSLTTDSSKLRHLITRRSPTTETQQLIDHKWSVKPILRSIQIYAGIALRFDRKSDLRRAMKPGPGSRPGLGEYYYRCQNLALYIRDCESLCLSDETVKAVGPFYLVSMPGEVKDPTQGVNV